MDVERENQRKEKREKRKENKKKKEKKRKEETVDVDIDERKCKEARFSFSLFSRPFVRSSFQCRCWQQQQCSSSSHVNSEEYHHCSDLKKKFSLQKEIFLVLKFFQRHSSICLSVYDRRCPTCT